MKIRLKFLLVVIVFTLLITLPASAAYTVMEKKQVYQVKDINKNLYENLSSNPYGFQTLYGKVYFIAKDVQHGKEVFFSDGTSNGTMVLKDIWPGQHDGVEVEGGFYKMALLNGQIFFTASDGIHGSEPWVSDGTENGTKMLADLFPGGSSNPIAYDTFAGAVYFTAKDASGEHLWRTDGSPSGTLKIFTSPSDRCLYPIKAWIAFDAEVYFTSSAPEGDPMDCALYRTDGTQGNETRIVWASTLDFFDRPEEMAVVGSKLFFSANHAGFYHLWVLESGTDEAHMVTSETSIEEPENPNELRSFNNQLYFKAENIEGGSYLWTTNGTPEGTHIIPAANGHPDYGSPYWITIWNNSLYFSANSLETDQELFRSDGSAVYLLKDIASDTCITIHDCGSNPGEFTLFGNQLIFSASGMNGYPNDREVWRTDGTEEGTYQISDICEGDCGSYPSNYSVIGDHILFSADDGVTGYELWAYIPLNRMIFLPLVNN